MKGQIKRFAQNESGVWNVEVIGTVEIRDQTPEVGFADGLVALTMPFRDWDDGPEPITPSKARVLAALLTAAADEAERSR